MSFWRPALIALALVTGTGSVFAAPPPKPKLVVSVIVDQFRYDYLTRFRSDYHGGFDQLLTHGADFTNASTRRFRPSRR
jgi:predicted AlkP superfamily pyrophosphatase or phosphodiesterase